VFPGIEWCHAIGGWGKIAGRTAVADDEAFMLPGLQERAGLERRSRTRLLTGPEFLIEPRRSPRFQQSIRKTEKTRGAFFLGIVIPIARCLRRCAVASRPVQADRIQL